MNSYCSEIASNANSRPYSFQQMLKSHNSMFVLMRKIDKFSSYLAYGMKFTKSAVVLSVWNGIFVLMRKMDTFCLFSALGMKPTKFSNFAVVLSCWLFLSFWNGFIMLRQHICTHAENGQILSIFRMGYETHQILTNIWIYTYYKAMIQT